MIFQNRIWDFIGNGNFGFLPKFLGKKCKNGILAKMMRNGHCLPLEEVKMGILDTLQKGGKH